MFPGGIGSIELLLLIATGVVCIGLFFILKRTS